MTNKIVLGSLIIIFFSFQSYENVSEVIRVKVENAATSKLTSFGETLHCSNSLKQFYQNRFFEAAWNLETSSQLLIALQKADEEGLLPQDYHLSKLQELSRKPPITVFAKGEYDMLLTDAFLLYTSHLLSGKVNPQTIDAEWHVLRREGFPVKRLEEAILSGDINKAIRESLPHHAAYHSLKNVLKTYRSIKADNWPSLTEGPTIKKGMEDDRIPLIRKRLIIFGDLTDDMNDNSLLYDDMLFAAVQAFQKRNGLESDGDIGTQTIGTLIKPINECINQIKVNMERWRWLPQELGEYYIKVNIANFELDVIKNKKLIRSHKIIAGKPYRRTPVFSSKMQYLVLNPSWTVPPGILYKDVLPAAKKDVSYLEKKKLSVFDVKGNPVNPLTIDWTNKEAQSYTYRQPPGPDNALGAVKFMFPNDFLVYLHDTPSKELFNKTERAFSSGCIRVHEPLSLAEYLLNDSVNWSKEKINKVVAGKQTQTLRLIEQPNVHILYWTAWTDANGILHFRKDIYERDKPLIKELMENPPA